MRIHLDTVTALDRWMDRIGTVSRHALHL